VNDSEKNHVAYGQLTVYEQFGWINMHAITFSFVDKSSSRGMEKFGENIPTSPEVVGAHMLNFKSNCKFLSSNYYFLGGGDPRPSWGMH